MGLFTTVADYVRNIFSKKSDVVLANCLNLILENCYKEFALQKSINLISASLCSVKFKTYIKNKEVKERLNYLLNISPNKNHNSYDFYYKIMDALIRKQEALVIQVNDEFYVADSFQKEKYAFMDWKFYNIIIDDFQLNKDFFMKDVFYFTYANDKIKNIVNSINANYSEVYAITKNALIQDKLRKIIVNFDSTNSLSENEDDESSLQNLVNEIIKPFLEGRRNVLTLPKGLQLEKFETKTSGTSFEELNNIGKKIIDNIASLLNIPIDIFYGDKTELSEQYDIYISNSFKPFSKILEVEMNRKLYTPKQYIEGSYIKVDISHLKYKDIFEIADGADKLARIGFTHNFIREKLDEEKVNKAFADESYVTKNNERVDNKEVNSCEKLSK